ncbi:endolytic transglycosylase MltG [Microbacterium lacus]|uniref:endolytic transglycosylase MltG n=1 Tax=Microbacterium lacus TaxID=415217 RepID=UPI00384E21EC
MPDPTFDDPFAELFGKLPDPRARDAASPPSVESPTARDAPPSSKSTAPLSRRAAREAANGQTGPVAPTTPSAPQTPEPVSAPASAPVSAPASVPPVEEHDPADAWLLAGAARGGANRYSAASAPGTGYARTGSGPIAMAAASRSTETPTGSTLEDLFTGSVSTDDLGSVPPPRDKRKRRIGGWIALGVVLALIGGIIAGGFYVWSNYEDNIRELMGWEEPNDYADGLATGEAVLTINEGDIPTTISQSLFDAGVTMTPTSFYDMLIKTSQNPTFYPGVYAMQQKMTSAAALAALQDPANRLENSALIPEGLTVDQTLTILADGVGIPLEDLNAAVADPAAYGIPVDQAVVAAGGNPLEGWLFPAMYTFNPGVTAPEVIQTLVNRTISSLDGAGVPVERRQEILTTAAIIQREARYAEDMAKVSRVIQNRMDPNNQETFGYLQMDSTAQYGYGELNAGSVSTSEEAQYDNNPWNTYVLQGLPVGPIANPGDVAIEAAMNPPEGDWLYFVTVNLNTGETVFTSNYADHNRAVEQWLSWCADNPGSGC